MLQEMVLRPAVGMGQIVAVPYVVALGACDALEGAGIAWPHDIVDVATGSTLSHVNARGGYDSEGMFVKVELDLDADVRESVQRRVDEWAQGRTPAPLAAILSDYADRLVQLGKEVDVIFPNGKVHAHGTFAGVDVWGRATVRLATGKLIEFAPEKYRIA